MGHLGAILRYRHWPGWHLSALAGLIFLTRALGRTVWAVPFWVFLGRTKKDAFYVSGIRPFFVPPRSLKVLLDILPIAVSVSHGFTDERRPFKGPREPAPFRIRLLIAPTGGGVGRSLDGLMRPPKKEMISQERRGGQRRKAHEENRADQF